MSDVGTTPALSFNRRVDGLPRRHRGARARPRSTCAPASSSPWSVRRVAGRARCCASLPASPRPRWGSCHVDRSSLGYVFQDATLLQWRTVQRNVELLAELERMPAPERRQRTDDAIQLVGLTGFEEKYPKQLSGGMKMRASLARSLVLDPKVFLFDEPFGALDEITRERLNDEVIALFQRKGFAGLFITHSISEAVFLSTRVLVMSAATWPYRRRFRRAVRLPAVPRAALRSCIRCAVRSGLWRAQRSARMNASTTAVNSLDTADSPAERAAADLGPPHRADRPSAAAQQGHRRPWFCSASSSRSGT